MKYDLIWLEKEALPWLPTFMEIARLQGLPYVVDYDDAWFHRYENHWASPLLGHKIDAVMRVAHTVVAGNDYLARRARQAGARAVEIVPTAIDLARYRDLPAASAERRAHGRLDRHPAQCALSDDRSRPRCARLRSPPRSSCMSSARLCRPNLPASRPKAFPWTEDTEIASIAAFDVGIMPLHRHAVRARQVRLQAAAGDGGGQARDRLAGRCQPASGAAWRQRLPRRNDRGMGRGAAPRLPTRNFAAAWARRRAAPSKSGIPPRLSPRGLPRFSSVLRRSCEQFRAVDRSRAPLYGPPAQLKLGRSQVVRQRILIPPSPGSNPGAPASSTRHVKSQSCRSGRAYAFQKFQTRLHGSGLTFGSVSKNIMMVARGPRGGLNFQPKATTGNSVSVSSGIGRKFDLMRPRAPRIQRQQGWT